MVKKGNAKKGGMKKSGQTAAVDDRFLDLAAHPMFKEMSSRKKKVPIDERFKEMLTDERFSEKPSKVCFLMQKKSRQEGNKKSIINN